MNSKIYAASVLFKIENDIMHRPFLVLAKNPLEAEELVLQKALENYPRDLGYYHHDINISEISISQDTVNRFTTKDNNGK